MSGRLGEVARHLETTRELGLVIGAMRAIASARSREAQRSLAAVRDFAQTLGIAIGEALVLPRGPADELPTARQPRQVVLAICAEQGFVGGFDARLLETLAGSLDADTELWLLGERGQVAAPEHRLVPTWSASMAVHLDDVPELATTLLERIYAGLDERPLHFSLLHAQPGEAGPPTLLSRRLLPFDYGRFPLARRGSAPCTHLSPAALVAGLADEYLFAELCEALVLAYAAENDARMQAMISAEGHLQERRESLLGEYRRLRQDEITEEIIELTPRGPAGDG